MLRYLTAGESHGPCLTAVVEGIPANLEVLAAEIDTFLKRRQSGYGRGGRMAIEQDHVRILSGVRWGRTLGSPITLSIENRDWVNWTQTMSVRPEDRDETKSITWPRPGHADLNGVVKYRQRDVRNILERSSARETSIRVAVGALCQILLRNLGMEFASYVTEIGGVAARDDSQDYVSRRLLAEKSCCGTFDLEAETAMKARIDAASVAGDSLGGVVEVVVLGLPVGLGSHVQWDRRLDARLAAAVMSIQAFKGVEIGLGFDAARLPGSKVHDEIGREAGRGFFRFTNNAGGLEGGMTTGEPLVIRGAMKPIPTLRQPLRTVDIVSGAPHEASKERSDVCAVPAAAVVAEAVVAIEIANAVLEKFGGDTMEDLKDNVQQFREYTAQL